MFAGTEILKLSILECQNTTYLASCFIFLSLLLLFEKELQLLQWLKQLYHGQYTHFPNLMVISYAIQQRHDKFEL